MTADFAVDAGRQTGPDVRRLLLNGFRVFVFGTAAPVRSSSCRVQIEREIKFIFNNAGMTHFAYPVTRLGTAELRLRTHISRHESTSESWQRRVCVILFIKYNPIQGVLGK